MAGIIDYVLHCYREKPQVEDGEKLKGEDKEEAKKNNEAARLWISGIETIKRKLGLAAVYDCEIKLPSPNTSSISARTR